MLRDYQSAIVDRVDQAWAGGARFPCVVMPTGAGKTRTFTHIAANHRGSVAAIAHRQELVSQISIAFAQEGIAHNIVAPQSVVSNISKIHREEFGRSFYSPSSMAHVVSVDTLMARGPADWCDQVTLWICDEAAHLLTENKWGKAVAMFRNARGLGVTATPCRADGKGLGSHAHGVFDALIMGPTMRELINRGYLSEYELIVPHSDFDPSRLTVGSTGDYTPKSLKAETKRSKIVGDVVNNYIVWALGTQAIVFATDVETSDEIAEKFIASGITAASLHANTSDYDRFRTIKQFKNREISVLINVGLFDEGFDVPGVETVVMARPTKSLGLYLQQIGRGLRIAPGKSRALIIDMVNNYLEHGLPDRSRVWTLDARVSGRNAPRDPNEIPLTRCEKCFHPYARVHRACPHCGHEPVIVGRRGPDQVDGDMLMLDIDTLVKLREAATLESPQDMAQRVAAAAGPIAGKAAFNRQYERIQTQQQLAHTIAQWAGIGRAAGMDDSELYRRFYHWIGCDVLTALSGDVATMRKFIEVINA